MISTAESEPPGCPLFAAAIILTMCRRSVRAMCASSAVEIVGDAATIVLRTGKRSASLNNRRPEPSAQFDCFAQSARGALRHVPGSLGRERERRALARLALDCQL